MTTDLHPGRTPDVALRAPAGVEDDRSGHVRSGSRIADAGPVDQAPVSQRASDAQAPIADGPDVLDGREETGDRAIVAVEGQTSADQNGFDAQTRTVGGPVAAAANGAPSPNVSTPQHPSLSAAADDVSEPIEPVLQQTPAGSDDPTEPNVPAARLADIHLALLAEAVDDLERTRIANENRHRSLIQVYGLEGTPQEQAARMLVDGLVALEHQTTLQLARAMRAHPLGPWVKRSAGVGEKQAARLLAAVGDPYWNTLHDRPRTVSELWAYCGLHTLPAGHTSCDAHPPGADGQPLDPAGQWPDDAHTSTASGPSSPVSHMTSVAESGQRTNADGPTFPVGHIGTGDHSNHADGDNPPGTHVAARRRKGQRANWSAAAKMRAYLIATSCVKQLKPGCKPAEGETVAHGPDCVCSPYRVVYDQRRARTAETHADWTPLHSHNDGLRIAAKTVLKDMWREARALHEQAT